MHKNNQKGVYDIPKVEVIMARIERGFQSSGPLPENGTESFTDSGNTYDGANCLD